MFSYHFIKYALAIKPVFDWIFAILMSGYAWWQIALHLMKSNETDKGASQDDR